MRRRCIPYRLTYSGSARIGLGCVLLGAGLLAGCSREAPKPDPVPRYRTLGPKPDIAPHLRGTILETVDVHGIEPVIIAGYGVVVNLDNTGRDDGIPTPVREAVLNTATIRGIGSQHTAGALGSVSTARFISDARNAIVLVEGVVPPGARRGDRVDVRVTALDSNTTTSLARGVLWRTELYAGIVTPQSPGERVNLAGQARGRLAVNPVYALDDPLQVKQDADAQASLRTAYVQDGAIFDGIQATDRMIVLRLREPSWRLARAVEHRVNLHFGKKVAFAQDEGQVHLRLPPEYRGDWSHFVGLTTTLFFSINKQYAVERGEELIAAATNPATPEADLEGISYALEGLGSLVTPKLLPAYSDPNAAVAFCAARAGAFLEDPVAVATLVRLAKEPGNAYAVPATQTLGRMWRRTGGVVQHLHDLLNVPAQDVRIAAYRALLAIEPQAVVSIQVGDNSYGKQFYLDRAESRAAPIIWASRAGTPRLAVIGEVPRLVPGALAAAFGGRLTVSASGDGTRATVFYRPLNDNSTSVEIYADVLELAATLGGESRPGELPVRLAYGDVIAVLKRMCDEGQVVDSQGRPVVMVLEDLAAGLVEEAPSIPGLEDARVNGQAMPPAEVQNAPRGSESARP